MSRIFIEPFCINGERLDTIEERVSNFSKTYVLSGLDYSKGFTEEYQYDLRQHPKAKVISRVEMNQLFYDITEGLGYLQKHGVDEWQAKFSPYGIGDCVRYNTAGGSGTYLSLINNNTSKPGSFDETEGKWVPLVDLSKNINSLIDRASLLEQRTNKVEDHLNKIDSSLTNIVSDYTQQINSLLSALTSTKTTLNTYVKKVDTLVNQVDQLFKADNSLRTELNSVNSALKTQIKTLDDGLKIKINSLTEKDTSLEKQINTLVQKDTSLQTQINSLTEKDTSLQTQINNNKTSLQTQINTLAQKDTSLQTQINTLVQKDTSLQTQINTLVQKDTSLQTQINTANTTAKQALTKAQEATNTISAKWSDKFYLQLTWLYYKLWSNADKVGMSKVDARWDGSYINYWYDFDINSPYGNSRYPTPPGRWKP